MVAYLENRMRVSWLRTGTSIADSIDYSEKGIGINISGTIFRIASNYSSTKETNWVDPIREEEQTKDNVFVRMKTTVDILINKDGKMVVISEEVLETLVLAFLWNVRAKKVEGIPVFRVPEEGKIENTNVGASSEQTTSKIRVKSVVYKDVGIDLSSEDIEKDGTLYDEGKAMIIIIGIVAVWKVESNDIRITNSVYKEGRILYIFSIFVRAVLQTNS